MKPLAALFALLLFLGAGCIKSEQVPGTDLIELRCYSPCHISLADYDDPMYRPTCIASAEPIACTEEYRVGDACLVYIHCNFEECDCSTEIDPGFDGCISCYRDCLGMAEDGADAMVCDAMCRPDASET